MQSSTRRPPGRRGRDSQPLEIEEVAERIRDEVDTHVKTDYDDRSRYDLAQQLHLGRQIAIIIDDADRHDERAANHEAYEVMIHIWLHRHIVQDSQHGDHKGKVYTDSAYTRYRLLMHLARVRCIHSPRLVREQDDSWRHEQADARRNDERQRKIWH